MKGAPVPTRHPLAVGAVVALSVYLFAAGLATSASGRALNDCGPCPFVATLSPKQEPHGTSGAGIGLLRAVMTSHPPRRSQDAPFNQHDTLSWRLTFRSLSGPALAAQIRIGRPGSTGPVAITLCAPCRSNAHGSTRLGRRLAIVVDQGSICDKQHPCSLAEPNQIGAYVEIRTSAHPQGEIRGQLRLCTPNSYEHRGACTPPGYPLR
jgi:CHRD domain-containing protein